MSHIVKCDDCGRHVELIRLHGQGLTLTCDCVENRSVRVKRALPEVWLD